jgi:hypothetical protein
MSGAILVKFNVPNYLRLKIRRFLFKHSYNDETLIFKSKANR